MTNTFRTTLPIFTDADGFYLKPEFYVARIEGDPFNHRVEFDMTYTVSMKAPLFVPKHQELRMRIENGVLIVECVKHE